MISRWKWLLLLLSRRLWVRASLISLLAVAAALGSLGLSHFLPPGLSTRIGAESVDSILTIIASSMLAVTIFSLSTMVSAYAAATSSVTPRATNLLIQDTTSQNVLAVFLGSFLYSLVAIITLSMDAYGGEGLVVLFAVTILVVLLIVATMLRWIDYVTRLGRVDQTTNEVERAAAAAMRARRERPCLGGRQLTDPERMIPAEARPIFPDRIGYVQNIAMVAISRHARERGGQVYLAAVPGTFMDLAKPLAWIVGLDDEGDLDAVRAAFTVDDERSFDQDPRFGLSVLAEIASRALSPALNDPGTAIDVIGRAVRTLAIWVEEDDEEKEPDFPEIFVPALSVENLFDDIFHPIARDGASLAEVHIRLQKALAALARTGDKRFRANALRHSAMALQRAEESMTFRADLDRVRRAAADLR